MNMGKNTIKRNWILLHRKQTQLEQELRPGSLKAKAPNNNHNNRGLSPAADFPPHITHFLSIFYRHCNKDFQLQTVKLTQVEPVYIQKYKKSVTLKFSVCKIFNVTTSAANDSHLKVTLFINFNHRNVCKCITPKL